MQPQQPIQPAAGQPAPAGSLPNSTPLGPGVTSSTPPPNPARNPNSTQNTLLFSELRDSMVIMNDGSFRAVVTCQSINFDLMSDREREAVEYSYQSFLNSLYFPAQIFVRSQRVDIAPYMDRLAKTRRDQDNMLLGILMEDYINFIGSLAEEVNIMDKVFYIVVPYYPSGDVNAIIKNSKNIFSAFFSNDKQQYIKIDQAAYQKAKDEVANRVNVVVSGLYQMGVRGTQLNTKQLAEMYYNMYNPDTAVREPLGNYEDVTSTFVRKGEGEAPQPNLERGAQ